MHTETTTTDTTRCPIHIIQDGIYAGSGTLTAEGHIEDCAAILGPDGLDHGDGSQQEAAERAYEAIERAIREGEDAVELDGVTYTWEIEGEAS